MATTGKPRPVSVTISSGPIIILASRAGFMKIATSANGILTIGRDDPRYREILIALRKSNTH